MLILIKDMKQLKFSALMDIYTESNYRKAAAEHPDLSVNEALFLVESDFYHYLKYDFFPVSESYYAIWEEKGKWVSSLRMEPYMDGMLLAGLETHPGQRAKGFAGLLIKHTLEQLPPDIKVYSHVDKDNLASLKAHSRCGFVNFLPYAAYIDGHVDDRSVTMLYAGGQGKRC